MAWIPKALLSVASDIVVAGYVSGDTATAAAVVARIGPIAQSAAAAYLATSPAVTAAAVAAAGPAVTAEIVANNLISGSDPRAAILTNPDDPNFSFAVIDPTTAKVSEVAADPSGNLAAHAVRGAGSRMEAGTKSLRSTVFAFGDSLVEQDWCATLQTSLTGTTVTNRGLSGQTSGAIAARQGGNVITVASFVIPAGTTAVAVTPAFSLAVANMKNNAIDTVLAGSFAGIPGSLVRNFTTNLWAFTRTTAGTATNVPSGTVFVPTFGSPARGGVQIFWAGTNDVAFSAPNHATGTTEAIQAMADYMNTDIKRYLVISVTGSTSYTRGTVLYGYVKETNDLLKARFPTAFVDLRRELIDNGLSIMGLGAGTTADQAAIAADTLPPSLMVDDTHFTAGVRAQVIAPFIKKALVAREWAI